MDIPLENHLCFKLYVSSRLIVKLFAESMSTLGLTYPKYLVLAALSEQNNQTVTELGQKLHLDSGTLSPLLKSLVTDGFIVRRRPETDERIVSNSITERGRLVRGKATEASYNIFCETGVSFDALNSLRVAMDDFILKCQLMQDVQAEVKSLKTASKPKKMTPTLKRTNRKVTPLSKGEFN